MLVAGIAVIDRLDRPAVIGLNAAALLYPFDARACLDQQFIDEASRMYADALSHDVVQVSAFVSIYALISRMRVISSIQVVAKAEKVTSVIANAYSPLNTDFPGLRKMLNSPGIDVLPDFSEGVKPLATLCPLSFNVHVARMLVLYRFANRLVSTVIAFAIQTATFDSAGWSAIARPDLSSHNEVIGRNRRIQTTPTVSLPPFSEPFGPTTVPLTGGESLTKWRLVELKIRGEIETLDRCHTTLEFCPPSVQEGKRVVTVQVNVRERPRRCRRRPCASKRLAMSSA